ncbi:hypothetical protein MY1884_004854 [Beauveria asiatica]
MHAMQATKHFMKTGRTWIFLSNTQYLFSRSCPVRPGVRTLRKMTTSVPTFPTTGFDLLPSHVPVEEETTPSYVAEKFYPVKLGKIFHARYQVLAKLGFDCLALPGSPERLFFYNEDLHYWTRH